jgi:antitoxin VapB
MKIKKVDIHNVSGEQIIHLPNDLRIDDIKVYLKKVGDAIYIIPFHSPWKNLLDSLDEFSPDFMDDRNQPVN